MSTNSSNQLTGSPASGRGTGYPPEDTDFGPRIAEFRGKSIGFRTWLLIFIPGGMIVVFGYAYGTFLARNALIDHGMALALTRAQYWFTMASVLLLLLSFYFAHRLLISLQRFEVFEQGVMLRTYFLRNLRFRWDEFSGITSASTAFTLGGRKIRTSPQAILQLNCGKSIDISNRFGSIPRLVKIIKSKIYPIIWPGIESDFQSGRFIKFGQVALNRDTIMISKSKFPWTDVNQVGLKDGFLVIELRDESRRRVPIKSISNLELLMKTFALGN